MNVGALGLISAIGAYGGFVIPQVLNASSGAGVSLNELFQTIEKVTGTPLPRSHELDRPVDARQIVMDSTMARDRYGWVPATPLEEGLRKTWDWFNRTRH